MHLRKVNFKLGLRKLIYYLMLYVPVSQNGQTHLNNLSVFTDELFECI